MAARYLVVSLEHDGRPVVGEYLRTEEDAVIYRRPDGSEGMAPADCVEVRPADARKDR